MPIRVRLFALQIGGHGTDKSPVIAGSSREIFSLHPTSNIDLILRNLSADLQSETAM